MYLREMKVLLLNDWAEMSGGAEDHLFREAELLKDNHDIFIAGFGARDEMDDTKFKIKEPKGWAAQKFFKLTFHPVVYRKLRKIVNRVDPDIIHIHNNHKYPASLLLACRDYPVIHTAHDFYLVCPTGWSVYKDSLGVCSNGIGLKCIQHNCKNAFELSLYQWPLFKIREFLHRKIVDLFISPSKILANSLSNHGYKAVVIPNPAAISYLSHKGKNTKNRFESQKGYILYVGALEPIKGVRFLLKGFKEASKGSTSMLRLKIAGSGSQKELLKELAKDLEIDTRVDFLGFVPHDRIKKLYQKAIMLVVPSIGMENFPTVILEAMAAGCPVIGSNRGGIPELLRGDRGLLFEATKPNSLAKAILKMLNNPALRKTIARNSQLFVQKELSEEIYTRKIMEAFTEASKNDNF